MVEDVRKEIININNLISLNNNLLKENREVKAKLKYTEKYFVNVVKKNKNFYFLLMKLNKVWLLFWLFTYVMFCIIMLRLVQILVIKW